MECCCVVDYGGEPPEVYRRATHVARKVHTCCECGDEIPKGAEYEYACSLYDRVWESYHTCALCRRIRDDICLNMHLGLSEVLLECYGVDL